MGSLVLPFTSSLQLVESSSLSSLPLRLYALPFQSYRKHVKEILGNFKDPVTVDLVVLKKMKLFYEDSEMAA